ncbi:unnamed protein product, partial [Mesorhabditis belari]|uniref:Peptidase C1A papain C-terminal domain-containing protein n=1 Tax=Mesorhabditis belari TaxID=2138241 RepID=A0AAF3J2E1_9BILA
MLKSRERRDASGRPKCGFWHIAAPILVTLIAIALVVSLLLIYVNSQRIRREIDENAEYLNDLVRKVNENPKSTWKAKFNKFGSKAKDYGLKSPRNETAITEYFNLLEKFFEWDIMKNHIKTLQEFPVDELPESFDSREKWSNCPSISYVPNQGGCGSCYAVAAVGVAADRACIQSNGTYKALFSDEDVLGCCAVCGNCLGGDPLKALTYWVQEGLVTGGRDGCRPYSFDTSCGVPCSPAVFPENEKSRGCVRRCQNIYYQNKYDDDKHYASIAYSMYPRGMTLSADGKKRAQVPTIIGHINKTMEEPISLDEIRTILKTELFLFGPTTMAFPVPEEFLHYAEGVFRPITEEKFNDRVVYWHVVRLIGWGKDKDGAHYWLAVNSFGRNWGDNGVFKINVDSMEKFGLEYEAALI